MQTSNVNLNDFNRLAEKLNQLNPKEQKKLHKKTLSDVNRILVNETKRNLRQVTGRSRTKGSVTQKGAKRGSLESGITSRVWKSNKGATVTILGDYRLKWFEEGTVERLTKKNMGRYHKTKSSGKMKPSKFFQKAVDSKKNTAIQEVQNAFEKNLKKIWNNK